MAMRWLAAIVVGMAALGGCAQPKSHAVNLDPRADEALRAMSSALARADGFSFDVTTVATEPAETGQMVQVQAKNVVAVRRPDRLYVDNRPGAEIWRLWHAGGDLTIADVSAGRYATANVPARNDAMAGKLASEYGVVLPLADLLFPDPYKVMTADVLSGTYVGEHEVDGVKCAHLMFRQQNIDWQVWIEQGKTPLLRKLVIDYKQEAGRPQFSAVLSNWKLSAPPDGTFKAELPEGAKRVEMSELLSARPAR